MATVYRRTRREPIPEGAEVVERKGKKWVTWADAKGRHRARLAKDEAAILIELPGYTIQYHDEAGRRRKESVRAADLDTARQIAAEREKAVLLRKKGILDATQERFALAARRPLGEHLAEFLRFLGDKGDTPKHVATCKRHVKWVAEQIDAKGIRDLTGPAVLRAVGELRTGKKARSARTCNSYLTSCKALTRWLWEHKRTPDDALAGLDGWNEEADRRHVRRELTPEEIALLLQATEKRDTGAGRMPGRDRAMAYRVALGTGFRAKELRSLTPECFDLDSDPPTVTVGAAYSKRGREDVQPIRRDLAEALRPWLADKPSGVRLFARLPGNTARAIRGDLLAARKAWIEAAPEGPEREAREKSDFLCYKDRAGRVADFHSTRHAYISGIVAGGASAKAAQELARHSTPSLTIGRYSHARLHDLTGALEALPSLQPEPESTDQQRAALRATGTEDAAPGAEKDAGQMPSSACNIRGQKWGQLSGGGGLKLAEDGRPERELHGEEAIPQVFPMAGLGENRQPPAEGEKKRRRPDSNRGWRICNPLP